MSWHRTSRKYHKWLMLFIGAQFVIWAFSGAYMVVMDIDYIHGDNLVTKQNQYLDNKQINYSIAQLLSSYPEAKNIELALMLDKPVYRFELAKKSQLVSAKNGQLLPAIDKKLAIEIAMHAYVNKTVTLRKASLLTAQAPRELSARHLPVWRIDFDDFASPTFYISMHSGLLVTKRHSFWRFFDWMFAFHVMDYVDEEADNTLLLVFILLALLASIFGVILSYFRTIKTNNKPSPKSKSPIKASKRHQAVQVAKDVHLEQK